MKNINDEVKIILKNAENEMMKLNHPYVGTEHLILSLLHTNEIEVITKKYGLTYKKYLDTILKVIGKSNIKSKVILYTPLLRNVINYTLEQEIINSKTLLKSTLLSTDGIGLRILLLMNIDIDSIIDELENNIYNLELNAINIMNTNNKLIGRDKEINNIIEVLLRKNKNNPILIGEAGVGKTAIIEELARRIENKEVPDKLKNMKLYQLDMTSLLTNTKYRGEFETKLNDIIKEVIKNKNIILFIDEIHTIVNTGGGESGCDAANILKPYLSSNKLKLIGATTIKEYDTYINKDEALRRRFKKIFIEEPNLEETKNILKGVKNIYEDYHEIKISDENINDIVTLSDKYIKNNKNPDKSLEILDCVLSKINNRIITPEYIKDKNYKKALENLIKQKRITKENIIEVIEENAFIKILNQKDLNKLIKDLKNNTYISNYDLLKEQLKPKFKENKLVSLEFNGEKGTGKNYTAKLIGNLLNYNILELDMLEYQDSTSINKLIGSNAGYIGYEDKSLLDKIKYKPYTLLILKNYEYANINIKRLFESIIEKTYYLDKYGEIIDFNSCLIIKTTTTKENTIGYNKEPKNDKLVITFNKLNEKEIKRYLKNNNIKIDNIPNDISISSLHTYIDEVCNC